MTSSRPRVRFFGLPGKRLSVVACASLLALSSGARVARAQTTPDMTAAAEQLFEEGRSLMARERFGEACPKLAESHRLDPGVGTLLNLAECYEKQGRTASAWATYIEADTLANRLNQVQRAAFAAKRAQELAPSLPKLAIDVSETRNAGGAVTVTVRRDGELLARPAWATLVPMDPGEHRIEASAPGFRPFARTVIVRTGELARVAVPALTPDSEPRTSSTQKTVGLIVAGAGVVATGVGLGFGYVAKSKNDEAHTDFCSSVACTQHGKDLIGEADQAALLSTVLVSVGAAVLVGGAFVFFTAPSERRRATAWRLGGTF